MTEVPGTDRDQARENVSEETPLVPESVEGADDDGQEGEGATGDDAKPASGGTDFVT